MFEFGSSPCSSCGARNPRNARFCAGCGEPVAGKPVTCSSCGKEAGRAAFCTHCGASMSATASPQILDRRWKRRPGEFLTRVEIADLPGLLRSGLVVEQGTRALLMADGVYQGELEAGTYEWSSLGRSLRERTFQHWVEGPAQQATVFLTDAGDIDLAFEPMNVRTGDGVALSVKTSLTGRLESAQAFHQNLLKDQQSIRDEQVKQRLLEELHEALLATFERRNIDTLARSRNFRDEIESDLSSHLGRSLERIGFRLIRVRTLSFGNPRLDALGARKGDISLEIAEGRQELQGDEAREVLATDRDIHEVRAAGRRTDVRAEWRSLINSDAFNEFRAKGEFEAALLQHDKDGVMRSEERAELVAQFSARESAREHVLERLDLQEKHELERLQQSHLLGLQGDQKEHVREQYLRDKSSFVTAQAEEDRSELETARIWREQQLDLDSRQLHVGEDLEDRKARRERENLAARSTASAEALIAGAASPDIARTLAELATTRVHATVSPEQILAMVARTSPEAARAIQEKFAGQRGEDVQALYERVLTLMQGADIRNQETLQKILTQALETNRDVGVAGATSRPPFSLSGGPATGPGLAGAIIECLHCRHQQPPVNTFCENCGKKLRS